MIKREVSNDSNQLDNPTCIMDGDIQVPCDNLGISESIASYSEVIKTWPDGMIPYTISDQYGIHNSQSY